jgi:hypothetical protein
MSPTKTMGIELEELLLELDDDDLTDDESELLLELWVLLEDSPAKLEFFDEDIPLVTDDMDDELMTLALDEPSDSGSCAPQALRISASRTS